MFSIRSFVLYAVGTSMCGGLLVLLCLPLCALLRRLREKGKSVGEIKEMLWGE